MKGKKPTRQQKMILKERRVEFWIYKVCKWIRK